MNTFTQVRTIFYNIIPEFTYMLNKTMNHLNQDIRHVLRVRVAQTYLSRTNMQICTETGH
jgi:hypothetical protein